MTNKNDVNNSDSDREPRNSAHEESTKGTIKSLDEIITEHQGMTLEEAEDLWDNTGGCSCFDHPPCSFCTLYDWDNDPLDKL